MNEHGGGKNAAANRKSERDLEELRKMGLAPLERDVVTGQSISPHIPTTLAKAPWWYGASGPTLEHQRQVDKQDDRQLHTSADAAVVTGKSSTYHAGACENCGSRTHRTPSCLQPKKKVGAVHTRIVVGHDVATSLAPLSFEEKRNREASRTDNADDLWKEFEGKKKAGEEDGPASKKTRREDLSSLLLATANGTSSRDIAELPKYLENLETGQFYDPQTRSMRGNPHAAGVVSLTGYQGDNAKYETLDAHMFVEQQLHFLKGESRTVVDFSFDEQQFDRRKKLAEAAAAALGKERLALEDDTTASKARNAEPEKGVIGQLAVTDIPFTDDVLIGAAAASSSEPQTTKLAASPVAPGNHLFVFGSFYDRSRGVWGYKCCRGTQQHAPCTANRNQQAPSEAS